MTGEGKTALVTGASAGIGASFARHLATQGYDLLLVARREERLKALCDELTGEHAVRCDYFAADLSDSDSPQRVMDYAFDQKLDIDVLINNAGLSGKSKFADTPWDQIASELRLMVGAVTHLAHLAIPGMKERRWGRIVNVSSIAALQPPGASLLYTAIKSFVLNASQSLDMELKADGIHVTALCPGFTYSEFHDVMGTRDTADRLPSALWLEPEVVVRAGWTAVMKGDPVCVPGLVNKVLCAAVRPIPLRLQYQLGRTANPFKNA